MHTKESIKDLLQQSNLAVERAIVAIWNRQTVSEKSQRETVEHNGVGFASCHAKLGSYYSTWVLSGKRLSGRHLTKARDIALRYTRQLLEIAQSRAPKQESPVTEWRTPPVPANPILMPVTAAQRQQRKELWQRQAVAAASGVIGA